MESENNPPPSSNIKIHSTTQTLHLPDEIIEEILSRLPVKSLLKFRCVSKSWRSLIGSQRFIKNHLQNSTKNTSFAHQRIIFNSFLPHQKLKQCSLHSLVNEKSTDWSPIDDPINVGWESIRLVGSCNGLVCIVLDKRDFILWNPSTRMSKILPGVDDNVELSSYGFGCDESSGDYKIFAIISAFPVPGRYMARGKVYSLKTNSWTPMKDRDAPRTYERGLFANGRLYWPTGCLSCGRDIVSLDLRTEAYGMVEEPCYSEACFSKTVGVLGGCPCLLCNYRQTRIDVWVLKPHGMKESWEKVVTVTHLHDSQKNEFLTPFCIGSKGEILLALAWTFVIYYPKDNVLRYPKITDYDSFREADVYIESLVPLVSDGEQEAQTPEPVA